MRYKKGIVPDFIGLDRKTIKQFANQYNLDISFKGFGLAKRQSPLPGKKFSNNRILVEMVKPSYE